MDEEQEYRLNAERVVVFWRRDGQELHEQVDPGEVLPNHDGTFQVSVDLDLTAVPQEDWGRAPAPLAPTGSGADLFPLAPPGGAITELNQQHQSETCAVFQYPYFHEYT
ncbi:unnamed protein product [Boreogadus saida]